MINIGTLEELDAKPGDVVYSPTQGKHKLDGLYYIKHVFSDGAYVRLNIAGKDWTIISRASDTTKQWRYMTAEEKGALLLAYHDGKLIQYFGSMLKDDVWDDNEDPAWNDAFYYRVKPEPKVEVVTVYHDGVTFNYATTDGTPDGTNVKMELIK